MRKFKPGDYLVIAHRGYNVKYPENTMLAFREAIKNGANAFEMDVKPTKDNQFIVMHDTTVNRTTNGTGNVADLTFEELMKLDAGSWKGSEFANRNDTKIPSLDDCLDFVEENNIFIFIHSNAPVFTEQQMKDLIDRVEERGLLNKCIFLAESHAVFAKNYNPEITTFAWGGSTNTSNYKTRLKEAVDNQLYPFGVGNAVTAQMAQDIHAENMAILISWINSNYIVQTSKMANLGVDMFFTDDVRSSVRVLKERGMKQIAPVDIERDDVQAVTMLYNIGGKISKVRMCKNEEETIETIKKVVI